MEGGNAAVICRFQYSGRAVALVAALTLATLALLVLAPGGIALRVLAAAWTVCAALFALDRLPFVRGGRGPRALALQASGDMALQECDGRWRKGALRDGCFVAPWLVIVRWRPDGLRRDRMVLIVPGMAGAEALRRLRVILRWR